MMNKKNKEDSKSGEIKQNRERKLMAVIYKKTNENE